MLLATPTNQWFGKLIAMVLIILAIGGLIACETIKPPSTAAGVHEAQLANCLKLPTWQEMDMCRDAVNAQWGFCSVDGGALERCKR